MILIADSGSTKTEWGFLDDKKDNLISEGINPYYLTSEQIVTIINKTFSSCDEEISSVFFFGAGCNSYENKKIVEEAMQQCWPSAQLNVLSDLQAACYSTCKVEKGICCILGTGSNSCSYDGENITENISPLGFILGDEGSGAYLGRQLINMLYKQKVNKELLNSFESTFSYNKDIILNKVYKQAWPNRFMASLVPFIKQNIDKEEVVNLVKSAFSMFIENNLLQYSDIKQLQVHFVGSIAYHFQDILKQVMNSYGLYTGTVVQTPMGGLKEYYRNKM